MFKLKYGIFYCAVGVQTLMIGCSFNEIRRSDPESSGSRACCDSTTIKAVLSDIARAAAGFAKDNPRCPLPDNVDALTPYGLTHERVSVVSVAYAGLVFCSDVFPSGRNPTVYCYYRHDAKTDHPLVALLSDGSIVDMKYAEVERKVLEHRELVQNLRDTVLTHDW